MENCNLSRLPSIATVNHLLVFIRSHQKRYCRSALLRRYGNQILMYWPVPSGSALFVSL